MKNKNITIIENSETNLVTKNNIIELFKAAAIISIRLSILPLPFSSPLDILISEGYQMVDKLLINKTVHELDLKKVDKDYLYSNNFKNLLLKTMRLAFEESNKKKLKYFSKIIKNSLEVDNDNERKYNFEYIKVISELSIEQIYILEEFYNQQKTIFDEPKENICSYITENTQYHELSNIIYEKYQIEKEDYEFLLRRLLATGLLENSEEYVNGSYISGVNRITPTLNKLMKKVMEENF